MPQQVEGKKGWAKPLNNLVLLRKWGIPYDSVKSRHCGLYIVMVEDFGKF
jgi:hypothetical protein